MIWQHDVNHIVMVTSLFENGKAKCEKYWPNEVHETARFGRFLVTMSVEDSSADFMYREFALQNDEEADIQPRIVRHLHFLSWNDKCRPDLCYPLLSFRRKVKTLESTATGPLVIHCSAGIGRTGTYIALDYLLEQAKAEGEVDVFNCVKSLRHQRMNMVQTLDQYIFVHDALVDAVTTGDTAVLCSSFSSFYNEVNRNDTMLTLQDQFQLLQKLKTAAPDRQTIGRENVNAVKNRSAYIVAYDDCRPMLITPYKDGNEYINAVYINSFRRRNDYILTQLPLPWTIVDFWRLIIDHEVKTIILLDPITGSGEDSKDCPAYWPEQSGEQSYGPLEVELRNVDDEVADSAELKIREFAVRNPLLDDSEPSVVRQYHLLSWGSDSQQVPNNPTMLLELMNKVNNWQQQNKIDGPTVIQCIDGATKCGLYATACYVIDKMKTDHEVDIFLSCRYVTSQRPKAIDSLDQYKCLHDLASLCLAEYNEYDNFQPRNCTV
jgi:protein tyrosine phosphatase